MTESDEKTVNPDAIESLAEGCAEGRECLLAMADWYMERGQHIHVSACTWMYANNVFPWINEKTGAAYWCKDGNAFVETASPGSILPMSMWLMLNPFSVSLHTTMYASAGIAVLKFIEDVYIPWQSVRDDRLSMDTTLTTHRSRARKVR